MPSLIALFVMWCLDVRFPCDVVVFGCLLIKDLIPPTTRSPHSVVTRIGSVTRDQKVPGSNPVWVGCCGVDIYQWCLTGLTKAWWCA